MLQYYILMETKNKMKDFDSEFQECWEVVKKYFAKELEKNLTQHRVDERNIRYKLEIYQNFFPNFVYGNPTSTKTSDQDEKAKARPSETVQEEEVQTKEIKELGGGGQEKREPQTTQ